MVKYAKILAIEYHLPETKLDNNSLSILYDNWTAEKIFQKTGIQSRSIASDTECSSDLGILAAEKLFATQKIDRNQIDYLIFCTQSPDYFLPTTACLVQNRLGLSKSCGAIDINQGCSGFVYGLGLAKGLIESNQAKLVLLITAETYSKFIHPEDKSVRTLFGDAAAATLIGLNPEFESLHSFVYGSDGSGAENLIVPSGGMRQPVSEITSIEYKDESENKRSKNNLFMNGSEIFSFTLDVIPKTLDKILANANLKFEEIDYFVFHQANQFMLNHIKKKLKCPDEKFIINMSDCGNTVSSTIPIVINRMLQNKQLVTGQKLILMGFGVGYSWAGCVLQW
jgi:3-oxoacyl-[acyl-carrier-protein] synthase III